MMDAVLAVWKNQGLRVLVLLRYVVFFVGMGL
jgi:hypothetical protein